MWRCHRKRFLNKRRTSEFLGRSPLLKNGKLLTRGWVPTRSCHGKLGILKKGEGCRDDFQVATTLGAELDGGFTDIAPSFPTGLAERAVARSGPRRSGRRQVRKRHATIPTEVRVGTKWCSLTRFPTSAETTSQGNVRYCLSINLGGVALADVAAQTRLVEGLAPAVAVNPAMRTLEVA